MKELLYRNLLILTLPVFLSGWVACNGRSSQESKIDKFQEKVDEFVAEGLDFKLGKTKVEIVKNLGNPKTIRIQKVPNVHYPKYIVDEIHELFYDGFYIKLYKATETNKEMVEYLSVTSDRYKVKWGLNIGTHKNKVRNLLGPPLKKEKSVYTYQDRDGYPDHVYFYFRDDRIYKIEWEYYHD
jgi:hypothetical protein